MKKWLKKGLLQLLVGLLIMSTLPWTMIVSYAEELQVGTTQSSGNQTLTQESKVQEIDLPADTQKKLEEARQEQTEATEEPVSLQQNTLSVTDLSEGIISDFHQQAGNFIVEEVVEEAEAKGLSEVIEERTEKTKTFINDETGEGETLLFTDPIHFKRKESEWQELKGEFVPDTGSIRSLAPFSSIEVPNKLDETHDISVKIDNQLIKVSPSKANYEAVEVVEDSVLLGNGNKKEALSITSQEHSAELAHYLSSETKVQELSFDVSVPESWQVKFDQEIGTYGFYDQDVLKGVMTPPVIVDTANNLIS